MSTLDQLKSTAATALEGGKRQARRAQLEVKYRQVERRINQAYAKIGKTLYPLLAAREIATNNPAVEAAVKELAELEEDLAGRRAEIERVLHPEPDDASAKVEQPAES